MASSVDSALNGSASSNCDDSLGPAAANCLPARFDFTLRFEQLFLVILPCSLFLICLLPRIVRLSREPPKAAGALLDRLKIVTYLIFIALQLALLVLWSQNRRLANSTSVAAATFTLVDAIALATLSRLEHQRSTRPSTLILVYLIFSIAFDSVQCRTLWLVRADAVASVYTAMLGIKTIAFVLELKEKRRILLPSWNYLSPEMTASIVNRGLFWWLNDLLILGFRATLSGNALYDTDAAIKSWRLLGNIQAARSMWSSPKLGFFRHHKLLFALLDSIKGALILAVLPRLCWIAFKFAQPFLLNRVVRYVTDEKADDANKSIGFALVGATALVYMGIAFSKGFYQHQLFRSLTMVRGALVSLVLYRTLDSSPIPTTSDEKSNASSNSAALTLIGPDVMAITNALENFHELWANPIEIVLAIWLLSRETGAGSIGPAVAVIACTFAMTKLSRRMGPAMKAWNVAIQARISTTSGVLRHIKEVKMLGSIASWINVIQDQRVVELEWSKKFRTLIAYMNMLGNTPTALSPIVTFGIAIAVQGKSGEHFTVATAFTSLSIIGLIVAPLSHLLYAVPSFFSCLGSFERIEGFVDKNVTASSSGSLPSNIECDGNIELSAMTRKPREEIVKANDVSFRAAGQQEPILKNLHFAIAPSTLTVITGKVGSGKSMLLLGILGELEATGDLQVYLGGASFCSQETWLVQASIKLNIVGPEGGNVDDDWYQTVVEACALTRDFQQLSLGDSTNALTLSGGQKQRVALARAVYARKQVLVADDVFSGLDVDTRHHVWSHVFGPTGLLRQSRTTVILATHTLEYLRHADQIIILEKGEIAHLGSYVTVRGEASLLLSQTENPPPSCRRSSEISGQEEAATAKVEPKNEDEQEVEDLTKTGDTALYIFYFQSIGWRHAMTALFLATIPVFLQQFTQIWLKWWTEDGNSQAKVGMYYGTYVALLCLFILTIGLDCWFMFVNVIPRSATWLHLKLLETTLKASMTFFHCTDNGDLVNRFSQDMTLVDRELPAAVYTTLSAMLACIGEFILIVLGAKYLAAALPVALIILYALQKFYLSTSRQLRILDLQAKAPLYRHLLETIQGVATIRAFRWQGPTSQQLIELLDLSQRPHYLLLSIQRWLTLVLDLLVTVSAVLLVLFAVATSSNSPGYLAVAMYSVMGFSESLSNLLTSWTALETSLGAITRLRDFVKTTPQEVEPATDDCISLLPSWPTQGRIEWKNVNAAYQMTTTGEEGVPVLREVSLTISPGQKVAICGRTGSGKSSLLSTIFKLVDYTGIISIDGLDISNITNEGLRAGLIVVSQHPALLPGTLRSNLVHPKRKQPHPSDEEIIAVLESLQVWDAIQQFGSLDTHVENLSLSVGQQQLVCLARAILRKKESNILVLDEAMSAVDSETEKLMVAVLETEFASHTVLSVVHRLDTVRKYDTLVVLDGGRILHVGSPRDMIDGNGRLTV